MAAEFGRWGEVFGDDVVRAHTDGVRSAFDKALMQHAEAFDKLEHL